MFTRIPPGFISVYTSNMKLAEPTRLDTRAAKVRVEHNAEPACVAARRQFELGVISVLVLLCIIVLLAVKFGSVKPIEFAPTEAAPQPARASALVTFQEEVSRVVHNVVRHFNGSQPKAENRLIAGGNGGLKLRGVVAGPNQTVLLRRGNLPYALYLLGDNGYVIISGNEGRLVRPNDLRTMEGDASAAVTR